MRKDDKHERREEYGSKTHSFLEMTPRKRMPFTEVQQWTCHPRCGVRTLQNAQEHRRPGGRVLRRGDRGRSQRGSQEYVT